MPLPVVSFRINLNTCQIVCTPSRPGEPPFLCGKCCCIKWTTFSLLLLLLLLFMLLLLGLVIDGHVRLDAAATEAYRARRGNNDGRTTTVPMPTLTNNTRHDSSNNNNNNNNNGQQNDLIQTKRARNGCGC